MKSVLDYYSDTAYKTSFYRFDSYGSLIQNTIRRYIIEMGKVRKPVRVTLLVSKCTSSYQL